MRMRGSAGPAYTPGCPSARVAVSGRAARLWGGRGGDFLSHCFPVWSGRTGTVNGVWARPASCGGSEGAWTFPEVVGARVVAGPSRRPGQRGRSLRVTGGLGRGLPRRRDVKTGRLPGQELWLHGIQRTGLDVTSNWISSSWFKNNSVRRLESGAAAHAETRTGWQVVALAGPRTSGNSRRAGPLPSSVGRRFAEEPRGAGGRLRGIGVIGVSAIPTHRTAFSELPAESAR